MKEVPGIRTYIAVDGGMSDNIRPALYGAKYTAASANRMNAPHDKKVTIAGKCCESGDKLIEEAYLADPSEGDVIAVFALVRMATRWRAITTDCQSPPLFSVKMENINWLFVGRLMKMLSDWTSRYKQLGGRRRFEET